MNKNYTLNFYCIRFLFMWAFCFAAQGAYSVEGGTIKAGLPTYPGISSATMPKVEKETVKAWMSATVPVRFQENMGQMTDVNHQPVPFVLFKASAPGMDVYLTEKGLTYVFTKTEGMAAIAKSEQWQIGSPVDALTRAGEEIKMEMAWINLHLKEASIKRENIIREGASREDFNFFYAHCPGGIYGVKEYEKITIKEVYPGIDWVLYSNSNADLATGQAGMKYDFVVHPGADPAAIKLMYKSEKPLSVDSKGNLQIQTPLGKLTEEAPYSYIKETNQEVASQFQIIDQRHISSEAASSEGHYQTTINFKFQIKNFKSKTLVIDPQLVWATRYDHAGSWISGIACDDAGNVYATGGTYASALGSNFPLKSWEAFSYYQFIGGGLYFMPCAFILRFTNAGELTWATYYGGTSFDMGTSVVCDSAGNVFVTGVTTSANFPTFAGIGYYEPIGGGETYVLQPGPLRPPQYHTLYNFDVFILRFNNLGLREWATFYGGDMTPPNYTDCQSGMLAIGGYHVGNNFEFSTSIACDDEGNIYVAGYTNSPDMPTLPAVGARNQISLNGCENGFILSFNNVGVRLWATYCGGNTFDGINSIACDKAGNVYATGYAFSTSFPTGTGSLTGAYNQASNRGGYDAFILRFSNTLLNIGKAFTWGTYYGGGGQDVGRSIACDGAGNVYVTGTTSSANFPVQSQAGAYNQDTLGGGSDAFILRFNNAGVRTWASYYGGTGNETFNYGGLVPFDYKIQIDDNCGNVYVSFATTSSDIYTFGNPGGWQYHDQGHNGNTDNFLMKLSPVGSVLWATYFGGDGAERGQALALDNNENLFVGGAWAGGTASSYPFTDPGGGAYYKTSGTPYIAKFTSPTVPVTFSQSHENISNCTCNGSATASVSYGEAVFLWSTGDVITGDTTSSITGLCPGSYSVIVSHATCIDTLYYIILGDTTSPTAIVTTTLSTCGQNDGIATVTASGGALPYTYLWNDPIGQSNFIATGLASGIYEVTVTDASGCIVKETAIVNDLGGAAVTIDTIIHVTCNGSGNGAVYADVTGGAPPLTYAWSNGANTKDITGLLAETYNLTVTDLVGCKTSVSAVVSEPAELRADIISTSHVICNGDSNGAIAISVSGGTGGYSYEWSNMATTKDISNLAAGNYNVTVTDTNGCTAATGDIITEPPVLSAAVTEVTHLLCNSDSTGAINLTVSGGKGAHSYSWSNFASTKDISNLPAGVYNVMVTDANSCTAATGDTITEPPLLSVFPTDVVHNSCAGDTSGHIETAVSGGTGGYSYSWSNVDFNCFCPDTSIIDTTKNIYELRAGWYIVTVTDSNGCTANNVNVITEPQALSLNFTNVIHLSCNGDANGSATVNPSGGVPPYTYAWTPTGNINATNNGLSAGNYTVEVTDSNNCRQSASVSINEPDSIVVSVSEETTICEGENVTLTASATGGTAPYTYTWNPGTVSGSPITVSPSGDITYTVTVADQNNCSGSPQSVEVTVNALPVISFTTDPESGCAPLCVLLSNTTPDTDTLSWSFGDGESGAGSVITHCYAAPGAYDVSLAVTNSNGCTDSLSVQDLIHVYPIPVAGFSTSPSNSAPVSSPVFFNNSSTGADNWIWNFGNILNTVSTLKDPIFTYSALGSYIVHLTATNNEGCTDTISHTIIIEPEFTLYIPNAFTPDNDGLNDSFVPQGIELNDFEMEIFNRWGQSIYHTTEIDKPWDGSAEGGTEKVQQGVYVYKIWVKDFKEETHYYVGNVTLIR